ncbi:crotonase/enoyl-CoA hydratase family protein [Rhizobium sp. SSA_523]|uniref:crotonase/enoyl-CoA hydratase family protein n=1 Tax=Rhizobium sp. SSA_523 TaxID=2952477 RepID=UPI002090DAB3|nr:crotonase/enoyl-CoA hydratase family protein [Rhizobium sp. SSA_523]MCO5734559.1 crotonase/enoyl-CoA hydratase family protein [Rhizobium sp. SSA_523]WKC23341.1 crotonase/enoyl-CoA hydratase family protein [Rhizobium sp. SSA_523]
MTDLSAQAKSNLAQSWHPREEPGRPEATLSASAPFKTLGDLPLELRFPAGRYDNLGVRLDPAQRTLWYFMNPVDAPSYTPGLLSDLSRLRGEIQSFVRRNEADQPLLYLVNGSKMPGIFNLGGDLGYFGRHIRAKDREGLRRYARDCVDLVYTSSIAFDLPIILISLVQGDALGGGFEAAMASDIIIAERQAKFGLPEILFNLFPGMGAYSFLSRRLDPTRATKMIMSGQIYSAEDLHAMGLVDLVVDEGEGEAATREFIARHSRKHMIFRTLRDVKRRVNPLTHQELVDVVDLWVEAAMQLEDADLRKIDRLRLAQIKRLEAARQA